MQSKKEITIIIGVALALVVLVVVLVARSGVTQPNNSGVETVLADQVPDLTLQDYEGNEVNLRQIEGDIVLLNAWASWCPFCINEIPDFVEAQEKLGEQITVVLINREESLARAKRFTDDLEATGRVITLLDQDDLFYRSIGGFAMPETLLVKDGNIILHKRGPMTLREVELNVKSALESI